MTIPAIYAYFILLACLLSATWGIFYSVPDSLVSLFRYKLWRIRDELVDAIRDGRVVDSAESGQLVSVIEETIQHAPQWTLLRLLFTPGIARVTRDVAKTTQTRQLDLQSYRVRFAADVVLHLLYGSPSGWLIGAPIALCIALVSSHSVRGKFRPAAETAAVSLTEQIAPLFRGTAAAPLSTCV